MTTICKAFSMVALLAVSARATGEPASRASMIGQADLPQVAVPAAAGPRLQGLSPRYPVAAVRVNVPRSLQVSEANTFVPVADIVWRGEPQGDRHAQVARMFHEALLAGTNGMATGPAAIVAVEVTRFHCLTEKTRFTVGGNHAIHFTLTLRDAATGAVRKGPRAIVADVKASGGAAAIAEDQAGRTQRVVVVERIADVIRREISRPANDAMADAALVARSESATIVTATGL